MENLLSETDLRNLVQELSQGRELAKQLHSHLLQYSSRETGEGLLKEILNSFDQALFLINDSRRSEVAAMLVADPPLPLTGSPPTDVSDHECKDQANKKRRWTRKVEVCGETGMEGQLDDGYGWRKYGQKDIQGAKYPRGYYRCTNRYGQGCLATKQIQRSDDDPNMIHITYSGIHTCDRNKNPSPNDPTPIPVISPQNQLETFSWNQNNNQFLPQSHQPFFNIQTSLKPISQDLHSFDFSSSANIQPQSFTSNDREQLIYNLRISEYEAGRVVATSTTSTLDSTTLDIDFPQGLSFDFGSDFRFKG